MDQAILDSPHHIGLVDVDVKKGERNLGPRQFPEENDDFEARPTHRPPRSNVTISMYLSYFSNTKI